MSKTLENLIEQSTVLLSKYEGCVLLLEKKSDDYSIKLANETKESIALLKKEIEVLDVDETINTLNEASGKAIEALTVKSNEITAEMEKKLANLDIEQVIADFKSEADTIVENIKNEVASSTSSNGIGNYEVLSSKTIKCNHDSACTTGSTTYSSFMKVDDNRFAIAKLLYGGGHTEATIAPFSIDENGVISVHSVGQVFGNTSGQSISTTEFFTVDNTGKMFAYGNNMYPGQSNNKFGYFYGRVDENNNVTDTGSSVNENYHQSNGQYGGMLDGDGNGFYAEGSAYNRGDSKQRSININYSGNTPSLSVYNPSSDTSTGYASHIISQKGVSNSNIVGIIHFRTNSSTYYERAFNSGGSGQNYSIPNLDSEMIGFVLSNGKILNITKGNAGYRACIYSSYNSRTIIDNFELDINYFYPYWSNADISNVGQDTWLVYSYQARMMFTFHIDPDTYKVTIIDSALTGMIAGTSSQTSIKVAGANNEFLVISVATSGAYQNVKVIKNPLKMTIGA